MAAENREEAWALLLTRGTLRGHLFPPPETRDPVERMSPMVYHHHHHAGCCNLLVETKQKY